MEIMEDALNKKEILDFDITNGKMGGKYLTFFTDKQLFGIPISDIIQIIKVQEITKIPDFPYYAKGIINLRGEIIPVIDMRLRFHKDEVPYDERTCIIVTNIRKEGIGFIVDSVNEVTEIDLTQISEPPKMAGNEENAYLAGIGRVDDKVVLLLQTAKILGDNEIMLLNQTE